MDEIYNKLSNIEKKLDDLTEKIDILLKQNNDVSDDCRKMSIHIDFVNDIYHKIQYPFWNIINIANKYLTYNYNDDVDKLT